MNTQALTKPQAKTGSKREPKAEAMFLTDAQLKEEIGKCEYCAEKPCKEACPCDCSPADFIMAAKGGRPSDFRRAAALIMGHNPLGGVCGAVCPDKFCMKACAHATFDAPLNIPAIQATIVQKAKDLGVLPARFLRLTTTVPVSTQPIIPLP